MQTLFTAESTAQTNSDLKRCSGYKHPRTKEQKKAPHYTERSNFNKNKRQPDGLGTVCRSCSKAYKALWDVENPDHFSNWYSENKAHVSEYNAKRYAENGPRDVEERRETDRRYRENNKESIRKSNLKWTLNNKESVNKKSQKYRDRKRSLPNDGTTREQIYEDFNGVCFLCGEYVEWSDYHADHVWPQSRGGGTVYENYRPTHARCNSSKNDKSYFEIVVGWNGDWKNFTIDNLYLFNMCAQKHSEEIIKQALVAKEAATNLRKDINQ